MLTMCLLGFTQSVHVLTPTSTGKYLLKGYDPTSLPPNSYGVLLPPNTSIPDGWIEILDSNLIKNIRLGHAIFENPLPEGAKIIQKGDEKAKAALQ